MDVRDGQAYMFFFIEKQRFSLIATTLEQLTALTVYITVVHVYTTYTLRYILIFCMLVHSV